MLLGSGEGDWSRSGQVPSCTVIVRVQKGGVDLKVVIVEKEEKNYGHAVDPAGITCCSTCSSQPIVTTHVGVVMPCSPERENYYLGARGVARRDAMNVKVIGETQM